MPRGNKDKISGRAKKLEADTPSTLRVGLRPSPNFLNKNGLFLEEDPFIPDPVVIVIPGHPIAKERTRNNFRTPPKTRAYEELVAYISKSLVPQSKSSFMVLDVYTKNSNQDISNVLKSVEDGLVKGGFLVDDNLTWLPSVLVNGHKVKNVEDECVVVKVWNLDSISVSISIK